MKDITSTTFGIIIAFLLPGLILFLAIGLFYEPALNLLRTFSKSQSNMGLFFIVILYSLTLGLQICALRWVIYEKLFCRKYNIPKDCFKNLSEEKTLEAFRAAVDEHYRYHQFWGGLSLVLPFLFFALRSKYSLPFFTNSILGCIITIIIEIITIFVAKDAYIKFSTRANNIMKGTKNYG